MSNPLQNIFQTSRVQDQNLLGLFEYNPVTLCTYWSEEIYAIFQLDPLIPAPDFNGLLKIIHHSDRERVSRLLQSGLVNKENCTVEYKIIRSDGKIRNLIHKNEIILNENGEIIRVIGTIQDVTPFKELDNKLKNTDEIIKVITNHLSVGIWTLDIKKNQMAYCSNGLADIMGYSTDEIIGDINLWKQSIHPSDINMIDASYEELMRVGNIAYQYRLIDKYGTIKWVHGQTVIIYDNEYQPMKMVGIISDISQSVESSINLNYIANHDALTGLPNRRHFMKKMNEIITKSAIEHKEFILYYFDLDRFKYINDFLGHEVGDRILRELARRLRAKLNPNYFLARLAGDEFVLVVKNPEQTSEEIARQLSIQVEEPFLIDNQELSITASIGICIFPYDGKNLQELLKKSDIALFRAKENGKGHYQFYSSAMDNKLHHFFTTETELKKALKGKEFFLEYQPEVESTTGIVKGAEALIRWNHPKKGIISPMQFIPVAEECGLIGGIGDWVIHKVCADINKWQSEGIDIVPISINLSPRRLLIPGIAQDIKNIINHYNVNPEFVIIEITERSILLNEMQTQAVIKELMEYGIRFALDDFGTGYSSLTSLTNYDISFLKIDKSFIAGLFKENRNKEIIKNLISLAKGIDMIVIAEGVETMDQLQFLLELECPFIQGFLFSRPVMEPEFSSYLRVGVLSPAE
ncbi:sensor domain-containing protein [Bacillus solitudinis]|uniref:sensor domain-containing protein n=1 Tax=Bacillus solitudinis TaxID=2014074 RepID=UPI000C243757|nr:GGDEF and EAL domain-containing protein [Bacillus solitudinis]